LVPRYCSKLWPSLLRCLHPLPEDRTAPLDLVVELYDLLKNLVLQENTEFRRVTHKNTRKILGTIILSSLQTKN
jgi:hypothetical protein